MSGEEGVMDLHSMSDEQLAELVEGARRVLAVRQTGAAIARDITGAVDPIVADNLELLGGHWSHGRVTWDGEALTIAALPDYGDVEVPEPEPEPVEPEEPDAPAWGPGIEVHAGDRLDYDGTVYRVVQAHTTAAHWLPSQLPALYTREG